MEHYEFISKTDNKSLFNQIKYLVTCAQESYQNDLATRREHLRELLEADEKVYENEFIGKIKSRVDENIRERQESLLSMKQERTKEIEKFVASKKLHQSMQNCIEIRRELRKKDYRETHLCQLEQMEDKKRAKARSEKDDEFWLNVQKRITDDVDRTQKREQAVKRDLQAHQSSILNKQLAEHQRMREMDLKHLNDEKMALNLKLKESHREEIEQARAAKLARNRDAKFALNTICEQKMLLKHEADTFEQLFHEETMRQVRNEIEEAMHKNLGLKQAVLDYLTYVKRFKNFAADQLRKRDEAYEELAKRFYCFKNQPRRGIAQRQRQAAESSHNILLQQICEEQARRLQLKAAERENRIIENSFARLQVREKFKEREKIKQDLDMQLEEIARLKVEKQKQFEGELNHAEADQLYCEKLLERHKADGCDYLPPHPNWKLLACYKSDADRRDEGS